MTARNTCFDCGYYKSSTICGFCYFMEFGVDINDGTEYDLDGAMDKVVRVKVPKSNIEAKVKAELERGRECGREAMRTLRSLSGGGTCAYSVCKYCRTKQFSGGFDDMSRGENMEEAVPAQMLEPKELEQAGDTEEEEAEASGVEVKAGLAVLSLSKQDSVVAEAGEGEAGRDMSNISECGNVVEGAEGARLTTIVGCAVTRSTMEGAVRDCNLQQDGLQRGECGEAGGEGEEAGEKSSD